MKKKISYKRIKNGNYDYELTKKYTCKVPGIPKDLKAEIPGFIRLENGNIKLYPTYQTDGATGIDGIYPEAWIIRGSYSHDGGYQ